MRPLSIQGRRGLHRCRGNRHRPDLRRRAGCGRFDDCARYGTRMDGAATSYRRRDCDGIRTHRLRELGIPARDHPWGCSAAIATTSAATEESWAFLTRRQFQGHQRHHPYKRLVMGYCTYIDPRAKGHPGAVNTVVNKNSLLYGYSTDHLGFCPTCATPGIDFARAGPSSSSVPAAAPTAPPALLCATKVRPSLAVSPDARHIKASSPMEEAVASGVRRSSSTNTMEMYPNVGVCSLDVAKCRAGSCAGRGVQPR